MSLRHLTIIVCDRDPALRLDHWRGVPARDKVGVDWRGRRTVVSDRTQRNIRRAAALIAKADALLITAGAGIGVDSGLPDFRGDQGFWRAYPALGQLGISFEEMAQPRWFDDRPEMAWAFYGHRQQLYRETQPHIGYRMLHDWGRAMPAGYFVVTSNVDGQFEAADFPVDRILEQHGNIHRYQCTTPCGGAIWWGDPPDLKIDLETITARGTLPRCPECGALARPNVLMFADGAWVAKLKHEQEQRYRAWLASVRGRRLVVLELGAGTAIATIRWHGEKLAGERPQTTLVRVNPDAADADEPVIAVRLGALEALRKIEENLPEGFKVAARTGDRSRAPVREAPVTEVANLPGAKVAMRRPERLPPAVATREIEMLDFDEPPVAESGRPAWWSAAASPSDLRAVTLLDLASGQVQPFNPHGMTAAELRACADCWYGAQREFGPLPEVGGYVESGFSFRGGVIRSADTPEGERPGAALVFICGPGEEPVLTVGVARQPSDGAFVWRYLYEQAQVRPRPMEHPRAPWVAFRHEPAAEKHAAMLPEIGEVAKRLAWTWLTVQAYYTKEDEDGDG